jgi:CheY-like chemotaxis protein
MGKILIFSELFEIREIIVQDFASEGHTVVSTGNAALTQDLLMTLVPDVVLLDIHLHRVNSWQMMQLIRKKFPGIFIFPFAAYTNMEGEVRLVIAHRDGGENLSFQDFKQRMNMLLNPKVHAEERKSEGHRLYPRS